MVQGQAEKAETNGREWGICWAERSIRKDFRIPDPLGSWERQSYSPEKIEEIKISINQWASSFFKNNDHLPDYVDPYSNYDYDWAIGTEDYNRGYLVQDIIEDAIAELNKEE